MSLLCRSLFVMLLFSSFLLSQNGEAPVVPSDLIWEPNLEYWATGGRHERLEMDVVHPRNISDEAPAVVLIHGGGFRAGTRQSYLPLCIKLAQRGYVAATVSYRLSPRYQFPAPIHDVKASVRWLRANAKRFGIDPDRIGAVGGSAGGHLALFLGLTAGVAEFEGNGPNPEVSSRVSCVVDYYGPTDFTKSYGKSVDAAEVLPQFLGGDLEHEPLNHIVASPLNWVTPQAAPVLSIHGTEDRYVSYEQSVWLVDRLRAAGVEAELEKLDGAGHGFKGVDAERAEQRMFAFLDKHLRGPKDERQILVANHGPGGEILALSWPSGKVLWRVPNLSGRDVQALPEGHVLFTLDIDHRVVEVDRNLRVVWEYGPAEGLEIPTAAERLKNGNTLIADAKQGKLLEVDPSGKVVWTYQSEEIGNMRMRNCRRTPSGTTLIAVEGGGRIIEVDPSGRVVWTYTVEGGARRLPYRAVRLENSNTLISLADPGEVLEVDSSGKIVRSLAGTGNDVRLGHVTGTIPLPGGAVILADYTGRRLLEVDSSGRVTHQLSTGSMDIASISLVP
jgi:acetyl esterase/lipase